MSNKVQSFIGLHISVLMLAGTALFSKLIQLSAIDITVLRSIFAALALLGLLLIGRQQLALHKRKDYFIVLALGVLLGAHWLTYFHAMQVSTVAIGLIALYTFPVMTVFLEPLFLGERPHYQDVISGFMVILGIYLMVPTFDLSNDIMLGVSWGLLSAVFYALRNVVQKHYFNHYPAKISLFYQILVVTVMVLPIMSEQPWTLGSSQWGLIILLGAVFTAIPHALFLNSFKHYKAKTASLIACLQVVYATILAALIIDEIPSWSTIIGGTIIVSAAAYESLRANKY